MPTSFVVKNGSKIFGCTSSGDARPVVVDLEDDRLRARRRARCGRRACRGRWPTSIACSALMTRFSSTCCIWCPSAKTCGRPDGERVDDGDVGDALLVGAQRQRLAHDLVHVDHRARRLALAREGEQVADDARGALGFAEDGLEPAPRRLVERPLRQPLGPGEDRGERVVQLVRDAGDGLAERGHLLGLQQLVIDVARLVVELLALADVAHERLDAQRAVARRRLGARRSPPPRPACRRRGAGAAGSR